MKDVLPDAIYDEIADHLRNASKEGESGWESAQDEEDSLTGDLGRSLKRGWTRTRYVGKQAWRWQFTYTKFRGRGKVAEEKIIGADGILQLEVSDVTTNKVINKGLLFQAKKSGSRATKELDEQTEKMENLVKGGSAVFEYGPHGYHAIDSRDVAKAEGNLREVSPKNVLKLGDYLADEFLACKTGLLGLYYEATRRTLFIPKKTGGFDRVRRRLNHRFKIEVQKLS